MPKYKLDVTKFEVQTLDASGRWVPLALAIEADTDAGTAAVCEVGTDGKIARDRFEQPITKQVQGKLRVVDVNTGEVNPAQSATPADPDPTP